MDKPKRKHKYHYIEYDGRHYFDNDWLAEVYDETETLTGMVANLEYDDSKLPEVRDKALLLMQRWNKFWRKVEDPPLGKSRPTPLHYLCISISEEETRY